MFEADQINLENPSDNNGFEPLIKSKADIPLSEEQAKKMEIVAKIRQIEAKTKESEAKAAQLQAQAGMGGGDPSMGGGIDPNTGMPMDPSMGGGAGGMPGMDPNTGMPMDPSMGGGQIDPNTGMPMDPNQQQDDPLLGLGDKSAPPDPMGGMGGGMDPMTGMPTPPQPSTVYTAIGRAYKLKQIFDYLLKIKKYLRDNTSSETNLEGLYDEVHQAYEMFRVVINNLKIYKDQIDDLIIKYYELIKLVLEKINNNLNEGELNDILDNEDILSDDDDEDESD